MIDSSASDEYLTEFRIKSNLLEGAPDFFKSSREAEMYCALGRHSESLIHFESALNGLKPFLEEDNDMWTSVYFSTAASYAAALDILGDLASAEQIYTHILENDPSNFCIGDFAIFLHRRKRDYNAAERFYLQALKLNPKHASVHFKFAGFLRHVRQDLEEAEKHYKLAVEHNPEYADAVGGYASFLHGTGGDKALAESLYEQSIGLDRTHVNNMCNYGLFLSEELKNFSKAETIYKQALDMFPKHANTLYNYAVMLDSHCGRKEEAEQFYRRCIEVEARHSFALYNLAVLREELLSSLRRSQEGEEGGRASAERGDPVWDRAAAEVRSLYERAMEADPNDATTMADCGRFISDKLRDPTTGEPFLRAALKLDTSCDVAALHLGIIELRFRKNFPIAISLFRSVLRRKPKHAAALHQLARALVEQFKNSDEGSLIEKKAADTNDGGKASPRRGTAMIAAASAALTADPPKMSPLDEAFTLFEEAASLAKDPGSVLYEYVEGVLEVGSPKQKLRAIVFVESAISENRSSPYMEGILRTLTKIKN